MDSATFVELRLSSGGETDDLTLICAGDGEVCQVYECTDIALRAMVEHGLIVMRNRDGKIVAPRDAGLADWMRMLHARFDQVEVVSGDVPWRETKDPMDQGAAVPPSEAAP